MEALQPGQIVQLAGKDATVIAVGDGIVHLEQDGQAISVHPGEVFVRGAVEAPSEEPPRSEVSAMMAEIVALKQRVTTLEAQANHIEKVLAALTAGPTKSSTDATDEASTTPAPTAATPAAVPENSGATGDAAASASE